jgi:hypothetical protein
VVNGGTGLATQTAHALYVGNGTSAPTAVGLGTTTQVLHGNASADPAFGALVTADLPSGVALTIASGTATLGTGAISANACASVVTVTATGVAATDRIAYTPNADISGVTGYGVASTDGLIVYPWPDAGHVNFKVCNSTGLSITPGAVTLNWGAVR